MSGSKVETKEVADVIKDKETCEKVKSKTYFTGSNGNQSAMRLGFLIGILLVSFIIFCLMIVIVICCFQELERLKIVLGSLSGFALLITSILTPLGIAKATQSFSENKGGG